MSDLFGACRLEEQVVRGGFSQVWRATDLRDGSPVAVKVLTSNRSVRDPWFQAALREEARPVALTYCEGARMAEVAATQAVGRG